jgi:hypothetical protein
MVASGIEVDRVGQAILAILSGLQKLGAASSRACNVGKATPHHQVVAKALAGVLSGGGTDITEPLREDGRPILDAFSGSIT